MSVYTASVEFTQPNKIDRFIHNDGDRKTVAESIFTMILLPLNPLNVITLGQTKVVTITDEIYIATICKWDLSM